MGEIGIKIINDNIVKFIPIEILSDTGEGYWINSEFLDKRNMISVIIQGQDFTIDNEKVEVIKKND